MIDDRRMEIIFSRRRPAGRTWAGRSAVGLAATIAFMTAILLPARGADISQRIANADSEPGNWLTYGRTYSEQHYSPLAEIDSGNIAKLGLAWSYDIDEFRPVEAMPLVVDGVMYVTAAWSKVYALDAATGKSCGATTPRCRKASSRMIAAAP